MDVAINPTSFPKIATRMKIDVNVTLGQRACVRVSFYEEDSEFTPLDVKVFVLENEEYTAWGNDDDYVKDWLFRKLGMEKIDT
jgi:hypothetical protein